MGRRYPSRELPCVSCGTPVQRSRPAKSEPKCRPCRRESHGTVAQYQKRGCRCIECRRAVAEAGALEYARGRRYRYISPEGRLAIYERDNWTCQLCGDPVDLTVHHLHRDAPTLDHIEPQSLALIPNHDPSNLRTAHRRCNSARGNRVEEAA